MTDVALFRNVNLGHLGSPTGEELLAAFGGPGSANIFQTNGTVLLTGASRESQIRQAIDKLRDAGYTQRLIVRPLSDIRRAVKSVIDPAPAENVYRVMISFFDVQSVPDISLPLRSPDRLVEVRALHTGAAVSACWKPGSKAGDVTGFMESLIHTAVTTRSLGTLQRLLNRADRSAGNTPEGCYPEV